MQKNHVPFKHVLSFVFSYFRRFPIMVFLVYLSLTVTVIAHLVFPFASGWLIDTVSASGVPTRAKFDRAFLFVLLLLGQSILYHISLRTAHFLNCVTDSRVERLVAAEALDRIQRFSTEWHINTFAGSTVTKIKRGMRSIHTFFDIICYDIYPTALIIVGTTVIVSLRQPILGAIFGLFSILYASLTIFLAVKYVAPSNRRANIEDNHIGGALADTLTSNATVKSFAGEERESRYFGSISRRWMYAARQSWIRGNIVRIFKDILNNTLKFLALGGAVWFWYIGEFTAGDVVFILTSYQVLSGYLKTIGDRIRDMYQAVNDMEDVVRFVHTPIDVKSLPEAKKMKVKNGSVKFEKVTFQYPNQNKPVFKNFSLDIKPGEKIALVGHSGSGKSTFVKLVQRLYDIQAGKILVDHQDIGKVTLQSLRSSIGLVPQEPILFHRSLAENIAYGKPNSTKKEVEAAAQKAHAHKFITQLPSGYKTLVGERGIKLSGGERQRVAIARAILADTPILVLDEATSSLDSESELLIQDALKNLLKDRTAIIIAHRLSTIRSSDRILVFEKGKIIEEDTHEALLEMSDGLYKKLFTLQAGGFI